MSVIWHNGEFKNKTDPVLLASDRALRGDGVFDTMLVIDGELVQAQAHFERLKAHASVLNIQINEDLESAAQALIKKQNHPGTLALNTTVTRGPAERGLKSPENPDIQIIMRLSEVPDEFPPVKAIIASVRRNEGSPLSQIKSINYGDNILALAEAEKAGANDAIMLNNQGHVTCTTTGNIFIEQNGELFTPPLSDGAMDGITRSILLKEKNAQEKTLTVEDLKNNDELFMTNSMRGKQLITLL